MLRRNSVVVIAIFIFIWALISYLLFAQSLTKNPYSNLRKSGRPSKLEASFYYQPIIPSSGQAIEFYDASSGNPESWLWNFGDGKTSLERNPSHIYEVPNIYYVTLRVIKGSLTSLNNRSICVKASANVDSLKPTADFIFEPDSPQMGVAVKFYDRSAGNPSQRLWQFGYFDFSFLKDPIRTFLSNRKFRVTLTVKNEFGSDKCTKYIDIGPPPDNIIIAKSCSQKDVHTAIAQANPGDTVIVPAGRATWTSNLVITKGVILKGAGIDKTVIVCNYTGVGGNGSPSQFFIAYAPASPAENQPFRLSGFTFDINNKLTGGLLLKNTTNYHQTKIRIDHTKWINIQNADPVQQILHIYGYFYGVADNNHFETPGRMRFEALDTTTWANETFNFGTADNFYMEDNFIRFWIDDSFYLEAAGRGAFRYNQIYCDVKSQYMPIWEPHDNQKNAWSAFMGLEVYENDVYLGTSNCNAVGFRGGRSLFYNNRFYQTGSNVIASAAEDNYDSDNPPAHAPDGQPQHMSDTYIWGNYRNSVLLVNNFPYTKSQLYYADEGCWIPTEDIHYWKHNPSFDGSSGVGVGPFSQRPTSCTTEGVAWWATDQNKLYRWHNGQWELYYVPYLYPHPLRNILSD